MELSAPRHRVPRKELYLHILTFLISTRRIRFQSNIHQQNTARMLKPVGLPFGRDEYNQIPIQWRVLRLNVEVMPWSAVEQVLATYTTNATRHLSAYMSTQQLPDEMNELYAGHLEPSATKILSQSPKCNSKKAWMTPKSPKSSKSPNKVKKKKTKKKKKVKKKTVSSSSPEGKKENAETKVEQNEEEDNDEGGGGEAGED